MARCSYNNVNNDGIVDVFTYTHTVVKNSEKDCYNDRDLFSPVAPINFKNLTTTLKIKTSHSSCS